LYGFAGDFAQDGNSSEICNAFRLALRRVYG
jgi:hypothetical protein